MYLARIEKGKQPLIVKLSDNVQVASLEVAANYAKWADTKIKTRAYRARAWLFPAERMIRPIGGAGAAAIGETPIRALTMAIQVMEEAKVKARAAKVTDKNLTRSG